MMKQTLKMPALGALLILCVAAGCARYAPEEVVPVHTMLDIHLTTAEPISNAFHYYIAMDSSGNTASDGPYEDLSGANRVKNWSYYIVYHYGVFEELLLTTAADADQYPTRFDQSSERYYSASASGNTINVILYLDKLAPTQRNVWFNFITSRYAITADLEDIPPVDYLTPPYFYVDSGRYPWRETSFSNTTISSYTPALEDDQPADIVSWQVDIYQR